MYPGYSTAVQYSRIYSCRTAVLASALVMLPPPLLCLMFAACSLGLGNCLKLLSIPTPPGALLKYSQYWSTASPQLHGPKAKPDSASKLKALRDGVVWS